MSSNVKLGGKFWLRMAIFVLIMLVLGPIAYRIGYYGGLN